MDSGKTPAQLDDEIVNYEQCLRDNPHAAPETTSEIRRRLRDLNYEKTINKKKKDHDNNSN